MAIMSSFSSFIFVCFVVSLIFALSAVASQKSAKAISTKKSDVECAACLVGLNFLEVVLDSQPSEDELAKAVEKVCSIIRHDLDPSVCHDAVTTFAPTVAPILSYSALNPRLRCQQFGLCHPNASKSDIDRLIDRNIDSDGRFVDTHKASRTKPSAPVALRIVHVSDVHQDPLYAIGAPTDCPQPLCCRNNSGGTGKAAYWGDYNCDLTRPMLFSALDFISTLSPDLVVVTGDTTPHDVWHESITSQLTDIGRVSSAFYATVPKPVFFAMGNHDTYPVDQFNLKPEDLAHHDNFEWLRDFFSQYWTEYLDAEGIASMKSSAHYTVVLKPGLRLVSMNTQWNDVINWYLYLMEEQYMAEIAWLQSTLQSARTNKERVILMGHISPGKGAVSALSKWAKLFLELYSEYRDVITAQLFGHTHNDEFEIIYDNVTKAPIGINYLTPSLTSFTGRNPSIRVFEFDAEFNVLDYVQYYANLTEANLNNSPTWRELYRATTYFGLPDLSAPSWDNHVQKMKASPAVFNSWYSIHTAGTVNPPCDAECVSSWICALISADPDETLLCGDFSSKPKRHSKH